MRFRSDFDTFETCRRTLKWSFIRVDRKSCRSTVKTTFLDPLRHGRVSFLLRCRGPDLLCSASNTWPWGVLSLKRDHFRAARSSVIRPRERSLLVRFVTHDRSLDYPRNNLRVKRSASVQWRVYAQYLRDGSAGLADSGSRHADTINSRPTGSHAAATCVIMKAVRLRNRRRRHCLRRSCESQGKPATATNLIIFLPSHGLALPRLGGSEP